MNSTYEILAVADLTESRTHQEYLLRVLFINPDSFSQAPKYATMDHVLEDGWEPFTVLPPQVFPQGLIPGSEAVASWSGPTFYFKRKIRSVSEEDA